MTTVDETTPSNKTDFQKLERHFADRAFDHMAATGPEALTDFVVSVTRATLAGRVPWVYRVHYEGSADFLLLGVQPNDHARTYDQRFLGDQIATYTTTFQIDTEQGGEKATMGVRIVVPDSFDPRILRATGSHHPPPFDFAIDLFRPSPDFDQVRLPYKGLVGQDAMTGLIAAARMAWVARYDKTQTTALEVRHASTTMIAKLTERFKYVVADEVEHAV